MKEQDTVNAQVGKWAAVGVSLWFSVAGAYRLPRGRAGEMEKALVILLRSLVFILWAVTIIGGFSGT